MIRVIVRHLIESSVFCLLMSFLSLSLQRSSAAARHALWLIGISKFSIPSLLLAATGAHVAYMMPASSQVSVMISAITLKVTEILTVAGKLFPSAFLPDGLPLPALAVLAIWAAGSVLLFATWFVRLRASYANGRTAGVDEQAALDSARRQLGIRSAVSLRCSASDQGPCLAGVRNPTVMIPEGLSQRLTGDEFDSVLRHELAHHQRRDNFTAAFVHSLVCLLWWHPLVWWVERRLIAEREHACDELVIASGIEREVYIAGILKVCRFHIAQPIAGASAITGSGLIKRVELIRSRPLRKPAICAPRFLFAAFAFAMTALPMAGGYCEQCVSDAQNTGIKTTRQTDMGRQTQPRDFYTRSKYTQVSGEDKQ